MIAGRPDSERGSVDNDKNIDSIFHALGDSTRRQILRRIAGSPASVSEIASPFPLTLAAVSKHIQVLVAAGLVAKEKSGRQFVCSLELKPLEKADAVIHELSTFWENRLDELNDFLIKTKTSGDTDG